MTTTLTTVKNILRKEFFVPARKIRSRQILSSDVGLSDFELNALLYFIEEKYQVELSEIKSDSTVQELVDTIDHTLTTEIL